MAPYSLDLRQRIVDAYRNGEGSVRELAKRFVVSPNTVQNYLTRMRATGRVTPSPHRGGSRPTIDEAGLQRLRALVQEKNDQTLPELAKRWAASERIQVSRWTVSRALRRLGLTRKKKDASCQRTRSRRSPGSTGPVSATRPRGRRAPVDLRR
jgi:transposase